MKTAMQELLKWAKNSDMSDTMISPQDLLNVINPLLEKEKQQIIDACWYGHDIKHEYFNPIHYIDKTYPQNK
jgi:hypothetical protein